MAKNQLTNEDVYQSHDKIYRKLLSDKTEVIGMLNSLYHFQNSISEDDIERSTCKYVNLQFENRETDVLYRLKNSNVFFLIEHQSRVDHNMSQRIVEYQVEIIKVENPKKHNSKGLVLPLIIPIVLYTNTNTTWNASKNIVDMQPVLNGYTNLGLGTYDVLDINNFETKELMDHELFLYRILSIEKAKNIEELSNILLYLLKNEKDKNHKDFLMDIIQYIYKTVLEDDNFYQYFYEEGDDADMGVIEMVLKEKNDLIALGLQQGRQSGIEEGRKVGLLEGIAEGRQKGIAEGRQKGIAEGRQKGIAEGRQKGIAEGRQKGIAEGRQRGIAEGRQRGIAEGRQKGIAEGKKKGLSEGIENITIEMIKQNLDDSLIMKITKISAKTLEKIKNKQKALRL